MARTSSLRFTIFLASVLTASSLACAPAASDDVDGAGQAIAEGEIAATALPIGPNGEDRAPSLAPSELGASTWKAFYVTKQGDPSATFLVLAAYDASDEERFELAVFRGADGTTVQLRDPDGAEVRDAKRDDGTPGLQVGRTRVGLEALRADLTALHARLAAGERSAGASEAGSVQTRSIGVEPGAECERLMTGAGAKFDLTILGALFTLGTCLGGAVVPIAGPVACAAMVAGTGALAYSTWNHGRAALKTCAVARAMAAR